MFYCIWSALVLFKLLVTLQRWKSLWCRIRVFFSGCCDPWRGHSNEKKTRHVARYKEDDSLQFRRGNASQQSQLLRVLLLSSLWNALFIVCQRSTCPKPDQRPVQNQSSEELSKVPPGASTWPFVKSAETLEHHDISVKSWGLLGRIHTGHSWGGDTRLSFCPWQPREASSAAHISSMQTRKRKSSETDHNVIHDILQDICPFASSGGSLSLFLGLGWGLQGLCLEGGHCWGQFTQQEAL